jgi:type IV pilus assembly protein PilW
MTKVKGFSLVELLIATAVGLVVLASMYGVFTIQNKALGDQEEIVAMKQSVRAGMDMLVREVGMAGYDPAFINTFIGVTVSASQHQIQADLDGNGAIDANSRENIIYAFDSTNKRITRNIGAGDQPFVENVEAFAFEYLDNTGNATAASANVRQIRITITGRTAKPDPSYSANGGYRTYSLTSVVRPQNLAF